MYTGMRRGAGTKSRIRFVLSGDYADTGVRELRDHKRKVNCADIFLKMCASLFVLFMIAALYRSSYRCSMETFSASLASG